MARAKKTEENSAPKKNVTRTKGNTAAAPAEAKEPIPFGLNEEDVRRRAYELFVSRNGENGTPEEDWYRAEQELRGKTA